MTWPVQTSIPRFITIPPNLLRHILGFDFFVHSYLHFRKYYVEVIFMTNMELPLGFGMALAQNEAAMKKFESMTESEKQAILQQTHNIKSKREMQQLVASLDAQG